MTSPSEAVQYSFPEFEVASSIPACTGFCGRDESPWEAPAIIWQKLSRLALKLSKIRSRRFQQGNNIFPAGVLIIIVVDGRNVIGKSPEDENCLSFAINRPEKLRLRFREDFFQTRCPCDCS